MGQELGVVEQLLEHRGDDERALDAVLLDERHPLARLELALQDDGAPTERTRERGLQASDVVERQREQGALLHVRVRRLHVREHERREAVVGEHHRLGLSGRARRVEQHRRLLRRTLREEHLVGVALRQQRLVGAPAVQRRSAVDGEDARGRRVGAQSRDERCVPLPRDDHLRRRMAQRVADLLAVAPEVERDVDGVQPRGCEVRLEVDRRVHVHDGDAVARPDAVRGECIGEPVGAVGEPGVGERAAIVNARGALGDDGGGDGLDVVGVQGSSPAGGTRPWQVSVAERRAAVQAAGRRRASCPRPR